MEIEKKNNKRKYRDEVLSFFEYCDSNKTYKCKVGDCGQILKSSYIYNLKRHIISKHNEVARSLNLSESESSDVKKKCKKISISMDKETLIKACVKMTTVHGLPFQTLEYNGFKDIISPIQESLGITINSKNIHQYITKCSEKIKQTIIDEVKNKIVCLKMDSATKYDRSILGINLQYLVGPKIVIRTIAMIEVTKQHTAENLKIEVLNVLKEFNVNLSQILCITTDNGANMVKAVKLLKESLELETEPEKENENLSEELQSHAEDIQVNLFVTSCRCATHTLQLCAIDVIKHHKENLQAIRDIVKKFKKNPYRNTFSANEKRKPFLDVPTRWNSSFEMINCLTTQKEFITDLISDDANFKISDELWTFIDKFQQAFSPVFVATKKLQEDQLVMGDFFKIWFECEIELQQGDENNEFSNQLLCAMQKRKKKLFENNVFVAAMYLDSRFNYSGSNIISDEEKKSAKVCKRRGANNLGNIVLKNVLIEPKFLPVISLSIPNNLNYT